MTPISKSVAKLGFSVLAGTGALRSSANDLLTFLAANLGFTKSPLAEAMAAMLAVQRPTGGFFVDTALGWTVDARGGGEIIWKNGGTGGYRSFIGYSRKARAGVVVLANATSGIDDIGLHLLDSRFGWPRRRVFQRKRPSMQVCSTATSAVTS